MRIENEELRYVKEKIVVVGQQGLKE